MPNEDKSEILEDVQLLWPNFKGRGGPYNREGERNFNVLLSAEQADRLAAGGWNVKTTKEREIDDESFGGEPYLPVKVKYDSRKPPRVVLITSRGRTDLGEEEVETLDFADITHVDVIVNPYDWTRPADGATGRSAYLKSIYVTINEDYLEQKYGSLPIAGAAHVTDPDEN